MGTFWKIAAGVAIGLVTLFGLVVLLAISSLRDPPFDPPPVAPLGTADGFRADRLVESRNGYVVAGVLGSSDPRRGTPCSSRFAVVFLDERGRAQRGAVVSVLERDRYCAERVDAVVAAPDGGWLVAGSGIRDGGPSALFPSKPSIDSTRVTFRLDETGSLDEAFGDGGAVRGHEVAGRVPGAVFTRGLERMDEDGSVHDDLVDSDDVFWGGSAYEVDGELLVPVDFGLDLTFQTYERDAPSVAVYRPLHPDPDLSREPTVDLGDVSVVDTELVDGTLYVAVRDEAGMRVNAVDPRLLRVRFAFGGGSGALRLRHAGYVTSARIVPGEPGWIVVALTAIDRGTPGDRLHVLRFDPLGRMDASFGGRVTRNGRDVLLDPGIRAALVDSGGRTLALGGGSTSIVRRESQLMRLDASGKADASFGDGGLVRLGGVPVCELAPARSGEACRAR
jgi:hypothetical protein